MRFLLVALLSLGENWSLQDHLTSSPHLTEKQNRNWTKAWAFEMFFMTLYSIISQVKLPYITGSLAFDIYIGQKKTLCKLQKNWQLLGQLYNLKPADFILFKSRGGWYLSALLWPSPVFCVSLPVLYVGHWSSVRLYGSFFSVLLLTAILMILAFLASFWVPLCHVQLITY